MGAEALAIALQCALAQRLLGRVAVAPLAGFGSRRFSLPRLERILSARDLYRHRHLAGTKTAHDGRGRAEHGAPRPDDAGTALWRLAHIALWLAGRCETGLTGLHFPRRDEL